MSCYSSEVGRFTLPPGALEEVRVNIVAAVNSRAAQRLLKLRALWENIRTGDHSDSTVRDAIEQATRTDCPPYKLAGETVYEHDEILAGIIADELDKHGRLRDDIDLYDVGGARDGAIRLSEGNLSVCFHADEGTLEWAVSDGNYAGPRAHRGELGEDVLQALGDVAWTPNTGGGIRRYTEYDADPTLPGNPGGQIVFRSGVLEATHSEAEAGRIRVPGRDRKVLRAPRSAQLQVHAQ